MDPVDHDAARHKCTACNRSFQTSGPYQNHLKSCKSSKKRLLDTLAAAKEVLARKRQRRNEAAVLDASTRSKEGTVTVGHVQPSALEVIHLTL